MNGSMHECLGLIPWPPRGPSRLRALQSPRGGTGGGSNLPLLQGPLRSMSPELELVAYQKLLQPGLGLFPGRWADSRM